VLPYGAAATFLPVAGAGRLDENPSHYLRRQREEVGPVPPFDAIDIDQSQVCLVHQRRRLERMILSLPSHVTAGQAVELTVQQRNHSLASRLVPLAPCSEKLCGLNIGIRRHDSFTIRWRLIG
jgi:hypothetical protein